MTYSRYADAQWLVANGYPQPWATRDQQGDDREGGDQNDEQGGTYGVCGTGPMEQVNIEHYSVESIQLFRVPDQKESNHFRELAELAKKVNKLVEQEGLKIVQEARQRYGDDALEITVVRGERGLELTYAASMRRMSKQRAAIYAPKGEKKRSLMPILIGALVVAALAIGGFLLWSGKLTSG